MVKVNQWVPCDVPQDRRVVHEVENADVLFSNHTAGKQTRKKKF